MGEVNWEFLGYTVGAFAMTYTFLLAIYGTGLAIYHWGRFLPKLRKKEYKVRTISAIAMTRRRI